MTVATDIKNIKNLVGSMKKDVDRLKYLLLGTDISGSGPLNASSISTGLTAGTIITGSITLGSGLKGDLGDTLAMLDDTDAVLQKLLSELETDTEV